MLAELCRVLLSEMGLPIEVLTETVIAVAEAIRGNYTNQEYFANTTLITNENLTRSSLVVLLISMTAEKQPFKMRCAVFYCFLSYLHDNEFGKTKVIETLLPTNQPDTTFSTGSLICQAITSSESVQCWFGCVSLLYCLLDVEHLRSSLEQLVERRVGRDTVIGAIEGLSRTEQFVRAAQKPQPLTKTPNELFLDYHFIKMFKSSESQLIKMLRPSGEFNGTASNDNIIQSFKDLIKRQDEEIAVLKQEAKRAAAQIEQLQKENDKTELERELESVRKSLEDSRLQNVQTEGMQLQMQEMYR
ncbi:Uso1 / p115 like vesicle tethering protein [Cooperia oncophora]